ncbi:hypothetical protein HMPREF9700_01201 [Bergeyella zoohelcum CCUG 30536]|uniref:Uncharacterized protein n=1 Tax=Bergeyella zoohelcum TaxID=1015 RepID=A0A380ZW09_9FLAO|nr:hypothetical protein HMPREF9700_01201 [Bergeyella zoohelcum CCUG 30536]GIM51390.1 hypothetical protein CAPN004_04200 [Capnocytophaga cynodegmi]SUV52936.1 Uncharacterised protein [Bergeyella zoohelcum]
MIFIKKIAKNNTKNYSLGKCLDFEDSLNQKEQFLFEGINLDIKMTVENKK